jgi:hypothetical protein
VAVAASRDNGLTLHKLSKSVVVSLVIVSRLALGVKVHRERRAFNHFFLNLPGGGNKMAEKKPITKVLFMKPKEAYLGLSEETRKGFVAKAMKDVIEVGGKWLIHCNCYWANEEWLWFGVMEFPDIAAVQQHSKFIEELEQIRYVESKSYLGSRVEGLLTVPYQEFRHLGRHSLHH